MCPYFSGRRWNLERHYEKVHGQIMNSQLKGIRQHARTVKKMNINNSKVADTFRTDSWDWPQRLEHFAKIQNTFANSKQTFDRLNFFQTKANRLEGQLQEIYQHYWIIPRFHVRGLNGHICKFCNSFSYRLVMDLGYDLTMKSKHSCDKQIGAFSVPIPKNIQDVDRWAANILFDQISYYESIGNQLALYYIEIFKDYKQIEDRERDRKLGIPDRFPLIDVEGDAITDLIISTLNSPGQKRLMLNTEILDLLTITKSTYGILKVPHKESFAYVYMKIVR